MCETLRCYHFGAELNPIMRNTRQDESQVGIKTTGRNINNLRYADVTALMAESQEELNSLLIRVKEENEKAGLKLNIQKANAMGFSRQEYWSGVPLPSPDELLLAK